MLNYEVFENVKNTNKQILVVTKYWEREKTLKILQECEKKFPEIFFWVWENRIEHLREKNLPREKTHFIGNIQSQKIPDIVKYCSVIHSLWSLKHARKIENQWFSVLACIQIRLDDNKNIGIRESALWEFLEACKDFKHLKIIWVSGMWTWDFSEDIKREEFQKLIFLRDTYLPTWMISAGTSRDYTIALQEWIDIVRIWDKALSSAHRKVEKQKDQK